ncbi:galactokinase [Bacillus alkalicellulosilyticus]|uniref:galactokinase n=1 Tax=Alkalihalobacterium alkalicellulosilyticum TaxID=1912214 RepID=UPI001FE81E51|nr:galactokinase [Bacillus alkalicellulosilyticus]
MNIELLIFTFTEIFGKTGKVRTFFAPGRVNLIGEHTDYNGGHVFPCALSIGTFAAVRPREDRKLKFYSINFPNQGIIETTLDELQYDVRDDWANYPKGVLVKAMEDGASITHGFDVVYYGTIPNGAGLSSSASIELVTAVIAKELYQLSFSQIELALLSQKAENDYIGVNCGIMDQFAIGMGKKEHAIFLNCQTLEYAYSPIHLRNLALVIINTNKRRGLTDSKYNERRSECENALALLQTRLEITSLGDLTPEQFEQHKDVIENETVRRRAKHAIYENARTIKAVEKLEQGDIIGFGKLMNESHISLRDDYEVTGIELDTLAQLAWDAGAIGARMTGAGFGGCTVNLVELEKVSEFIEKVSSQYEEKISVKPECYVVEIGDGAREITNQ